MRRTLLSIIVCLASACGGDDEPADGPPQATCGNGIVETGETCDDGNAVTEAACAYATASCTACDATCTASLSLTGAICGGIDLVE